VGEYSMQRKVHLGGASHFDRPHITLNKTGRLVLGTVLADYTIIVLNDGHTSGREPVHRSTAPLPRRMAGL